MDKTTDGFTLVEALFLILLLGMMLVSITGVYFSSSHAPHKDENRLPLFDIQTGKPLYPSK